MARGKVQNMSKNKILCNEAVFRCVVVIISLFMTGLGVSMLRMSCLGTDPFNSMNYGFCEYLHVPMSVGFIITSSVMLIFILFEKGNLIGFGTLASMTILGTAADFWTWVIKDCFHFSTELSGMGNWEMRIFFMLLGILIMLFFTSFYISADLGMAPYDAIGYVIENKVKKISFQWIRIFMDITCVVIAYCTAKKVGRQWDLIGIGTVIMALGTGPLLTFLRKNVAQPLLKKCMEVL